MSRQKFTYENVIQKFKKLHLNKYNYSKFEYINVKEKGIIICPLHGEFLQSYNSHFKRGEGCKKCSLNKISKNMTKVFEDFKDDIIKIHGDKYDYSKFIYVKKNIKGIIICPLHGEFLQSLNVHLDMKHGCKKCSLSHGERQISLLLDKYNIVHKCEFVFKDLILKRFDFYLPDYNMCIEYDGIQHFEEVSFFGGKQGFINIKESDKLKDKYCLDNNIKLIRIKYNEKNIEKIIKEIK